MKRKVDRILWIVSVAVVGSLTMVGCRPKDASEPSGVGERTGTAIDRAADKTADAAKTAVSATKDFTGAAVEKTGEVLEKAGTAVEKTGADMQK